MSDAATKPDRRSVLQPGVGTTSTVAGIGGLAVATVDYLFKCRGIHGWVQPDNALVILWATSLAPTLHLIVKIFNKHLQRMAEDADESPEHN